MIIESLAKIVSGSFVGYITNDLAVQMLFKKRFGLGGIVLKTHEQFVENISKLVEKEIINHHTLSKEFQNEDFRKSVELSVQDFYKNHLKNLLSNLSMADVPMAQNSWENISGSLVNAFNHTIHQNFSNFLKEIEFTKVVSDEQIQALAKNTTHELLLLPEKIDIQLSLENLLKSISKQSLLEIFGDDLVKKVSEDFTKIVEAYYNFLVESTKYTTFSQDILQQADLDVFVRFLSQSLAQKPIKSLISQEQWHSVLQEVLVQISNLLNSNKGNLIIQTLSKFILQTLQKEQTTVFELLSPTLERNFQNFLRKQLPKILQTFIVFIQEQKPKIDSLIDQTFRNNTQFALQDWLLDIFIGSVSENAEVVKKIINYIEKYDAGELAQIATNYLVDYLKSNTISKIISQVEPQKVIDFLSNAIGQNFNQLLTQIKPSFLDNYLDKNMGDFISSSQIENFIQKQLDKLKSGNWLYNLLQEVHLEDFIIQKIKEKQATFSQNALESIFSNTDFNNLAQWLTQKAKDTLVDNTIKENLSKNLEKIIQENLQKVRIDELFSENQTQKVVEQISKEVQKALQGFWQEFSHQPLQNYLSFLNADETLHQQTAKYLQETLLLELETLLKGRIEILVKQNLSSQPPEKIRDMVENFMGKELGPINMLGALLGGVAGGALLAIPQMENVYLGNTVNGLVYGTTGYGTNWLALKMIFRPYEKKKIAGITLPFTPGVITKNKSKFAQNMGRFVKDNLLQKESIINNFHGSRKVLRTSLLELIQKNEYGLLEGIISKNQNNITNYLQTKTLNYLDNKQENLYKAIEGKIETLLNQNLAQTDTSQLKNRFKAYLSNDRLQAQADDTIAKVLNLGQNPPKSLAGILPANTWTKTEEALQKFFRNQAEVFSNEDSTEKWLPALKKYLLARYQKLVEKRISEVLQKDQIENIKRNFANFLRTRMSSTNTQEQIYNGLAKRLEQEIDPQKKISEILGGRLVQFLQENSLNLIEQLLQKGIDWLAENKRELANEVYERAYQENKAAFIYKTVIRETVLELATYGIPNFFKKQMPDLIQLVKQEVNYIGEIRLENLQLGVNENSLKRWIEGFLSNPDLQEATGKVAEIFLEYSLLETPLLDFIKNEDIFGIQNLENTFQSEIKLIQGHIKGILSNPNNQLISKTSNFLTENFKQFAENYSQHWIHEDSQLIAKKIVTHILATPVFEEEKSKWIDEAFKHLKQQPLNQYIATDTLHKDLHKVMQEMLQKPEIKELLKTSIQDIADEILPKTLKLIHPETKEYFTFQILEAVFEALDENLPQLLLSIDLHRVVVQEIESMHPKEVEELFNSFAGLYFKQLINYGFGFGIVFGLAIDWAFLGVQKLVGE